MKFSPERRISIVAPRRLMGLWMGALLLLAACVAPSSVSPAAAPALPTPVPDTLSLVEPFARSAPLAGGNGAAYMILTNGRTTSVRLAGASTPAARLVEIHESRLDENSVMRMRHLAEGLTIPPQGVVALEPGGYHLMLIDLVAPLAPGDALELTLHFEDESTGPETTTLTFMVEDRGSIDDPKSGDHNH